MTPPTLPGTTSIHTKSNFYISYNNLLFRKEFLSNFNVVCFDQTMTSLFWFLRISIKILRKFMRNKINSLWIAKADKNTNFRLSFFFFCQHDASSFQKTFQGSCMMFSGKRKKKSDIAHFSEPDFNITKESNTIGILLPKLF